MCIEVVQVGAAHGCPHLSQGTDHTPRPGPLTLRALANAHCSPFPLPCCVTGSRGPSFLNPLDSMQPCGYLILYPL